MGSVVDNVGSFFEDPWKRLYSTATGESQKVGDGSSTDEGEETTEEDSGSGYNPKRVVLGGLDELERDASSTGKRSLRRPV